MRSRLAINRCPEHGWWAITIDDEMGGVRVTPSKCCGRWDTVKDWALSSREWLEIAEQATIAADALAVIEQAVAKDGRGTKRPKQSVARRAGKPKPTPRSTKA